MHRRRFLASAAGVASAALVAGCSSGADEGTSTTRLPSTTTTTGETSPTTTMADETTQTMTEPVGDVWVDRSFTYLYAGAHLNVYSVTGEGPVFVFALAADARQELALDGESQYPAQDVTNNIDADVVFHQRDTEDRGVVTYAVPGPVDATSGSIGSVELDQSQLEFLADPAEFAVTDVSVPDSVRQDSEALLTVTVENDGGSPGTFRAAATSESLSGYYPRSVVVPPGEQRSVEVGIPIHGENEERVNYTWGSGGGDRTVAVER